MTTANNNSNLGLTLTPRENAMITAIRDQLVETLNGANGGPLVVLDPAVEQVVTNRQIVNLVDEAVSIVLNSTETLTIENELFQFVQQLANSAADAEASVAAADAEALACAQLAAEDQEALQAANLVPPVSRTSATSATTTRATSTTTAPADASTAIAAAKAAAAAAGGGSSASDEASSTVAKFLERVNNTKNKN